MNPRAPFGDDRDSPGLERGEDAGADTDQETMSNTEADNLRDENERLRAENERLRGMLGLPPGVLPEAEVATARLFPEDDPLPQVHGRSPAWKKIALFRPRRLCDRPGPRRLVPQEWVQAAAKAGAPYLIHLSPL